MQRKQEEVEADIIVAAKHKEELQARHREGGYTDAHLEEHISLQVSLELAGAAQSSGRAAQSSGRAERDGVGAAAAPAR